MTDQVPTTKLNQLTIVGAGLIGGSVALAAREKGLAQRIVALDRNPAPPAPLRASIDEWIESGTPGAAERAFEKSELILLATPVHSIIELLPQALASGAWVTDCGSTKLAIAESVAGLLQAERFVPGHPMAGHPAGGLENARADLFQDRRWILCPEKSSPEAHLRIQQFVQDLGARPVELKAAEHDRAVAITSHCPQVVASALFLLAQREHAVHSAGPGFDSTTRVAGGAESMWRDIFETNGKEIGQALVQLGSQLEQAGQSLLKDESQAVLDLLKKARDLRAAEMKAKMHDIIMNL